MILLQQAGLTLIWVIFKSLMEYSTKAEQPKLSNNEFICTLHYRVIYVIVLSDKTYDLNEIHYMNTFGI